MGQMVVDEVSLTRVPLTRHHYTVRLRMGEHRWERWTLRMTSGPYRYVAGMGETLESVMLAFMGAMKFFSFKYGYTTLDPEAVRNRAQAVRDGLTTKEDHVRRAKPGRNGHR